MENKKNENLVWVDAEFTSLDFLTNEIVEIALVVTDKNLNLLDKGLNLVIHHNLETLEKMGE